MLSEIDTRSFAKLNEEVGILKRENDELKVAMSKINVTDLKRQIKLVKQEFEYNINNIDKYIHEMIKVNNREFSNISNENNNKYEHLFDLITRLENRIQVLEGEKYYNEENNIYDTYIKNHGGMVTKFTDGSCNQVNDPKLAAELHYSSCSDHDKRHYQEFSYKNNDDHYK